MNALKHPSFLFTSVVALSLFGASLLAEPVLAGSCTYPVTPGAFIGRVSSGVNVRNKTCMEESTVVGRVSGGATVQVLGEADGWYQVKLSDGTIGFVWGDFISKTDSSQVTKTETKTETKTDTKSTVTKVTESADLTARLKGHILLQVESHGEAWYVHPDDSKRYYMKDGKTAYEMMRSFGLGITNADLAKLKAGNKDLVTRLKGKIVLQVESHGEAYYIHPTKGTTHYLKNGDEAYRVMRELSLGITNKDLEAIKSRSFDAYVSEKETAKESVVDFSQNGMITLSAYLEGGVAHLNWNVKGFDAKEGFKVVYADSVNASYPGDAAEFVGATVRDHVLGSLKPDTTYYFRVCAYLGNGTCGTYSNEIALKTPVTSGKIVLNGYVENGKVYLDWTVAGMEAPNGFKVVWSTDATPVYPGDDYHYLGSGGARNDILHDMDAGTYRLRVCEYLGGSCGTYSNEIELTVPSNNVASINNPAQSGVVFSQANLDEINAYWLTTINNLRAGKGLRQLALDQRWVNTATEWATYMGVNNAATHNRPDGKSMHQWIDAKGLPFTVRNSADGWKTNYFTENISWGYASDASVSEVKQVLDDTLAFFLSEEASNGPHYRTIYHPDWNSVGLGLYFTPDGSGYKVHVAMHYGSLILN
jgi:uncharacterized protein YkwD/SH3-like domain-containing protein